MLQRRRRKLCACHSLHLMALLQDPQMSTQGWFSKAQGKLRRALFSYQQKRTLDCALKTNTSVLPQDGWMLASSFPLS